VLKERTLPSYSPLRAFLRTFSFGVSFVLLRFQLYQIISAPFPVRIFFPVAVGRPLPFGVFTTLAAFPGNS
ncbi:hypothetical protein ACIQM4_20220, partial [Streptomyces sp. NPDC091272]|uniref:hypothetical protein n=1 Tax=Streptomyces sp. NPDC091272 TaxID=3365981 RepID=UPI0038211668